MWCLWSKYIFPSLRIAAITTMTDVDVVEEILSQLVLQEEERFVAGFHHNVEKQRQKSWHDRHIKRKHFKVGGLFFMQDIKFFKHPRKLRTHWLGSSIITKITDGGAVKLLKLDGTEVQGMVNGI